jgi:hypothetical protein
MDSVLTVIHQCMQRGDRPLSVIDLIEKDMLSLSHAAWLATRIVEGTSWLVGAMPGNAGKTTLMCALLSLLPDREQVVMAHPGEKWEIYGQNTCVVTEEVSSHRQGHYIWESDVCGFTAIASRGGRICSTIHADTLESAREQIAITCKAGEKGLAAFGLFIPIKVTYPPEENASPISSPDGKNRGHGFGHHRIPLSRTVRNIHQYAGGAWKTINREVQLSSHEEKNGVFFSECMVSGVRTCEDLRSAWLDRS